MKKIVCLFFLLVSSFTFAQLSWQGGANPSETDSAVLLFDATGTPLQSYTGTIYAHTGVTIDDTTHWVNVIGTWGDNNAQPAFTFVSGETYSLDITPSIKEFYNNQTGTITGIDIVLRSADANTQTDDLNITVGAFQTTLTSPAENSTTILSSGGSLSITATNTNGNASYTLKANGSIIDTNASTANYSYNHTNITANQNYELEITQNTTTIVKKFSVIIDPTVISEALPIGLVNGINYNEGDPTKATLVIDAPFKDFIYVAGSFNNWQPDTNYAMKKDTSSDKFWLELTGLTPGQLETYQYWVVDKTPTTNSQPLVKTADPFSTLVLSYYDDSGIPSTTYPNLPAYPNTGNQFEVSVLQTNQTPYNWQINNFNKPKKEDLVVYEVLIRDFDADRNFQDIIDKISYFKNLNINAIELMPIMEFEGNESWGYNTVFHRALDKFYGTEDKLKELVDVCHQNGIAVIFDIALNHAFGRNPMVRMWCNDPDGDGYGAPNTDNPYLNTEAKHSYSVGNDFNHQSLKTQDYVKSVIKHWIEEFHIDGFRWDLTKGFTQNCTSGNETCTNAYQQDRVDVLEAYADYCWSLDPDHYVIFEHLGSDTEEQEWANYRYDEGKGIMLWSEMWNSYKNLAQGQSSSIDISRIGNTAHGFAGKRWVGYPESHDKDRLMYEMFQYGVNGVSGDLNVDLSRMSAIGAAFLTVPGPKMIWHFADLGMDDSIFTCTDGSVNTDYDGNNDGDCKLSTKPQPQWTENWLGDPNRNQIYSDWSRMIELKISEDVFEGDYTIESGTQTPKIYVFNNALPASSLKNVVILTNFSATAQNITPNFPYTGTWYNLFDKNTPMEVSNVSSTITLAPGEFKIFGNAPHIDPNDLDSDGIPNANDTCPNTPFGAVVDVNGCEIFSLPSNNFSLEIKGETCRTSNNGSINITANQNLNYSVHITGNGVDLTDTFTTTFSVGDLQAGNYEVCITVDGQADYEQCFNVSITEPEDISVLSKIDNTKSSVSLNMTGSSYYSVTLNGTTTQTTSSSIELKLINGANSIIVKGEKDCQGIYEETIFYGDDIMACPNPITNNVLNLYLGDLSSETSTVTMYSILGEQVFSTKTKDKNLKIDTSSLSKGIYILNVNTDKDIRSLKIVKN